MVFAETLQRLIDERKIARALCQGSDDAESIRVLQAGLKDLGFNLRAGRGKVDADGAYGAGTANAVSQFAERNGISGDGSKVTAALGRLLISRHWFLDDLRHLHDAAENDTTLRLLYRGSPERVAVTVLQEILNELGYGEQLKWARYGADGLYGKSTVAAVKAFAADCDLHSDGNSVTQEMARRALDKLVGRYGASWSKESAMVPTMRLSIKRTNKEVRVSDGKHTKTFRIYKRGIYTSGNQKADSFIKKNAETLAKLGLTRSAMNVMLSVSANEGNLDAINTWDNAFMTFGMFQWTIGQNSAQGELPALLKKIKEVDPGIFEQYYGRHGLDVAPETGTITGRLMLHGRKLRTASDKEALRSDRWAFYFWKSGQDPVVQAVQIEHAMSRIRTFYRSPKMRVSGHDIADIITSEFGVGLVLDNHVNRPGYVRSVLQKAVERAGLDDDPSRWGTEEEGRVIDAYLDIRKNYGRTPMTDAEHRAKTTMRFVSQGIISAERGSFRFA